MGKAARAMRRRAGVEDRKAAVKQLREARRAAAQQGQMVRGPGGPKLMRRLRPQPPKPRKVSFASMRDRVLADGSVVIGPDGEEKPLLAEAIAADRSNGSPIVERLPDKPILPLVERLPDAPIVERLPGKPIFDARGTQTGRFIEGRDYPAKEGDEVHAVAAGVVDETGEAEKKPDA